jgi:hypothetical protein
MRLVQWKQLDLFVSGGRIGELAREVIGRQRIPVEALRLHFLDGRIGVEATVRRGLSIPLRLSVARFEVRERMLVAYLSDMSAFGFLPVPTVLLRIFDARVALATGVSFDPHGDRLVIALDRFLPPFADITIESVRAVTGGIELRLGPGGADPPLEIQERSDGTAEP